MTRKKTNKLPFKPRARLLLLLGDQLIRDSRIAVFELVKNAYDADATIVRVEMCDVQSESSGRIVVHDNGCGMDWETLTGAWLEPGTDYRSLQRLSNGGRSPLGRMPIGEKGVGRFAVHKLGHKVRLTTRSKGKPEYTVDINWEEFDRERYLDDVKISISEREPTTFRRCKGTRIEITALRDAISWTRGRVRQLYRSVTSICSPYGGPEEFDVRLDLKPESDWLDDLPSLKQILEYSPFRARCLVKKSSMEYEYEFVSPLGLSRLEGRKTKKSRIKVPKRDDRGNFSPDCLVNLDTANVGPITIDLSIFDRDPQVFAASGVSSKKLLRDFLDTTGGIRVYRDGIRVYDYGEPGNDWLELGGRRVNIPAKRISNNLVLGSVSLDLSKSKGLIEKTNREGFVENRCYEEFRDAVLFAITQIETERNLDKDRIRKAYAKKAKEPVVEDAAEVRRLIGELNVSERSKDKVIGCIDRIERQFVGFRDQLLTAAGAGLSLALVVHEIEKGIKELVTAVKRKTSWRQLQSVTRHLDELIEGLTFLTRKSGRSREKAGELIRQSVFNCSYRLDYHGIKVVRGNSKGRSDFVIRCTRRLIIASLMNLIDNSIWWLKVKGGKNKRIFMGTTRDLPGGPALVIADSGPGFTDSPDFLMQPFITRKPDGMGLGLHLANEVMKAHGGRIEFPERGDIDLPAGFTGAVVALVFGEDE